MFANMVPTPPSIPVISLDVAFSNPSRKFFPGELVSGKVILTATEPISARYLKVSWKGETTCDWNGAEKETKKEHLSNYSMCWVSEDGKNEIPKGVHKYRFSFRIPADAPPSFTGTFGDILYWVKVELDRPWKWNVEVVKALRVMQKRGLEMAPTMLVPANFIGHKMSGTIFKDGVFSIKLNFPKRVFMAGETIRVNTTMENHSTKPITSLQFHLYQQYHHHSRPQINHCSLNNCLKECPVPAKYRRNAQQVIRQGFHRCHVAPNETKQVVVEIDLPRGLQATFESSMISMGYLVGFSITNGSWTNNKLQCNARIVIGNEEKIDGAGRGDLSKPPPYSP